MAGFLFENDVYCVKCNNFNTAVAANARVPASASFIDMSQFDHGVFLVGAGTQNTAATFQVWQDTSATETGSIKVLTSASQAVGGSDGDKWFTIEFSADQLDQDNDYHYVTLVPSAGTGSDDYYCVFFLGFDARTKPVTKETGYAYHVSVVS